MSSTKVKAIVIGGVNVKEKDKLITLYSLEKGKLSVSMKGVRGDKAKLKAAKDIFTFGDFVLEEGKFSTIVTAVDIIDNFYTLSKDIEKYYEGCAIVDIISKIATEPSPHLFIELIKALKTLCYENVKKYYVIDKFLLFVFKEMGYRFLNDKCAECGTTLNLKFFNFNMGEVVCPKCKELDSFQISDACYSAMRLLEKVDYERLSTVNLGGNGEIQTFNLLAKNFEYRTSYRVLDII